MATGKRAERLLEGIIKERQAPVPCLLDDVFRERRTLISSLLLHLQDLVFLTLRSDVWLHLPSTQQAIEKTHP